MKEYFEQFDRERSEDSGGPTSFGWVLLGLISLLGLFLWIYAAPRYVVFFSQDSGTVVSHERGDGTLPGRRSGELAVIFADVGPGRGILLQGPAGHNTLVDGGEGQHPQQPGASARDYAYELWFPLFESMGLRYMDHLVQTVPVSQYMGAQADLIGDVRIGFDTLYHTGSPARFTAYRRLHRLAEKRGVDRVRLRPGTTLEWGPGLRARVLPGVLSPGEDPGSARIIYLQYGRTRFLLVGDPPAPRLRDLVLRWGNSLQAEVLHLVQPVDRTTRELISFVQPDHLIVSAGAFSRPTEPDSLSSDSERGFDVFRLDELGSLALFTDGRRIRIQQAPLESQQ